MIAQYYLNNFSGYVITINFITMVFWGWFPAMRQGSALVRAQIMKVVEATGRVSRTPGIAKLSRRA